MLIDLVKESVYDMSAESGNRPNGLRGYKTLEMLGPEHEFSIVDEDLHPLPIVDVIIKRLCGRIRNNVYFQDFAFGKELQKHVAELKTETPFQSPIHFEETMFKAVEKVSSVLDSFEAKLLGMGMHPTLRLEEAKVWDHQNKGIYEVFNKIFNLKQHGWMNIQSFQLNLPYRSESEGVRLYNLIAKILPYIPAVSASSPIYESDFGELVDNRLHYYGINQAIVPSITGKIIPESIDSFETYCNLTIRKYSKDLIEVGAPNSIINREWINSRGAIIRFDRKAIEIRVMDEQECVKSDVALSCFIRALLRGLLKLDDESEIIDLPYSTLIENLNATIRYGLKARITHPSCLTAKEICSKLYSIAYENASEEERRYLWVVRKRIDNGNLSEIVSNHVKKRACKTDLKEAILSIYSNLAEKLVKNEIYE